MPLDSHAPQFPMEGFAVGAGPTSVAPPSADWFTFTTTCGVPENGTYQSRAVVAFGDPTPVVRQ